MKNKIIYSLTIISFIFLFVIFYKGLKKPNFYQPKSELKKNIPYFSSINFFEKEIINSEDIFNQNKFYLFNIWASWCVPCKDEHMFLVNLSKINNLEIIGLNYKDNYENAKKFIKELGNPYNKILVDKDGTIAIEWGAYGVPETFLIHQNQIIKRIIGPLNTKTMKDIESFLK
ncbi:DsbE family thiol:disulfide interchange protein [Candidatus Pelagibacter communis]|uniref:DsbE family thiol:disulfide interchange protein n=1 Tax=Pelagibacter ubique TaxID=198252 RepID=UPI00094D1F38|nr:DsbE family thiol:disulfide interchange protein [Candidatus Pelagibacter ubique]